MDSLHIAKTIWSILDEYIAFSKHKLEVHRKNGSYFRLHKLFCILVIDLMQNNTILVKIYFENLAINS